MSRKDTILRSAQRTAKEARAAATKRIRSKEDSVIHPHRHCSICWKPISLERIPPVCNNDECSDSWLKKDKSRKRLTIMMYLFPAIAIIFLLISLQQGAGN